MQPWPLESGNTVLDVPCRMLGLDENHVLKKAEAEICGLIVEFETLNSLAFRIQAAGVSTQHADRIMNWDLRSDFVSKCAKKQNQAAIKPYTNITVQ